MTHTYEGFLFGHYDSRGGTSFVVGTNLDKATLHYARGFGYYEPMFADADENEKWKRELLEGLREELISPAVLTSDVELENETELDGTWDGTAGRVWVVSPRDVDPSLLDVDDQADANLYDLLLEEDSPVSLEYRSTGGERPSPRHVMVRWDDDAFSLIFDGIGGNQ